MLVFRFINPADAIENPLHRPQQRRKQRSLAVENAGHVTAQRPRDRDNDHAIERNLNPSIECHGVFLESLRAHQRVNKIGKDEERDERAEAVIECHGRRLQLVAQQRIICACYEKRGSRRDEGDVEHGTLPFESANIVIAA